MPEGFSYLRSGASRSGDEPEVVPEESGQGQDGDYPVDGNIPAVKNWVGDDVGRAQIAYDYEQDRSGGPRKGVLDFLDELLSPDE